MEISRIKIAGCEINVLYVGKRYIFYSNFYGVIGYADRKGYDGGNEHTFKLYAGTENTVGGSVNRSSIITAMKRFINMAECKFVQNKTYYEISDKMVNCGVEVNLVEYK